MSPARLDPTSHLPGKLDLGGRRILLVEDDAANVRFIRESLGEGYEFVEAADGEQALGLVRDAAPDLIISDVEMPRMGGLDLCRILKNNPLFSFIPFILVTARTDTLDKVRGLELGADDYLIKPLDALELSARVRSMLRLKALQDALMAANARLSDINQKLQQLSMYDTLTGIYNRLYFNKRLDVEFQRAVRYKLDLSFVMLDVDHFKHVNDTYGHQMGDAVLQGVASVIQAQLRQMDLVARYGGEELVVVLPNTALEPALQVAERLREAVEAAEFTDGRASVGRTVSLGVASWPHPAIRSDDDLIRFADEALYRAKQGGRNRVEAHR